MPFPIYDTQDAIPADQLDVYELRDGKWHPKVPDVTNLQKALNTERERATDEARKRGEAETALSTLQATVDAKKNGVTEEQLEQIRVAEAAKHAPTAARLLEVETENRKLKLTDKVRARALHHGVMSKRIETAMLLLDKRTDLGDKGGVIVKDNDGNVTAEDLDTFLSTTFFEEHKYLYQGKNSSGSALDDDDSTPAPRTVHAPRQAASVLGAF